MATQADAIGLVGWPRAKTNDLGHITVALLVQAAGPVAVLAFDPLLVVEGVPEIAGRIIVTDRARV
jgi:hypothetical protein